MLLQKKKKAALLPLFENMRKQAINVILLSLIHIYMCIRDSDNTEALTAIDVNTGKYVGTTNLEDTVVNANLEAVEEIVRQIRLRNIGGIIIIDFIDMEKPEDREKVIAALANELKKDRVKTNILGLTQLGSVSYTHLLWKG